MLGTSAEFLPVISSPSILARQAGGWHRAASVGFRDLSLTVAGRAFDRINSAAWLHWLLHDWVEARQLSRPDVGDFPVADLQARRFTLAGLRLSDGSENKFRNRGGRYHDCYQRGFARWCCVFHLVMPDAWSWQRYIAASRLLLIVSAARHK